MSPAIAKARAFLKAFAMCGNVTKAAEAVGIEKTIVYRWKDKNPKFLAAFKRAEDQFGDVLESEAIRRANEGILEPVFYQGAACGAIRKFSDGLMWHLLERFKPAKYGKRVEVSGPGGGPIPISRAVAALSDEELATAIKLADRLAGGAAPSAPQPDAEAD